MLEARKKLCNGASEDELDFENTKQKINAATHLLATAADAKQTPKTLQRALEEYKSKSYTLGFWQIGLVKPYQQSIKIK